MTKACSGCGEAKSLEDFASHPNGKHGRTNKCRPCVSAYNRERYQRNRERIREQQRQYRLANPDKIADGKRRWESRWSAEYREEVNRRARDRRQTPEVQAKEAAYRKSYYELNRDRVGEYQARYREENRDLTRARVAKWKRENRDKVRDYSMRRRARLLNAEGDHSHEDWLRVLRIWNFACAYCDNGGRLTKDHVIPLSRGGSNSIGNIVPACLSCNSSKCDKLLIEWKSSRKGIS